jgi:hypothetical protein
LLAKIAAEEQLWNRKNFVYFGIKINDTIANAATLVSGSTLYATEADMIETKDLITFLKTGQSLCGTEIGHRKADVISTFGEDLIQYGEKDYGYFELPKGIRLGYWGDQIDELTVLNKREDAIFELNVTDLHETFTIGPKTTIHEAIKFLNWSYVRWSVVDTANKFSLTLLTEGQVGLVFDLEDGELMKISTARGKHESSGQHQISKTKAE